MPVRLLREGILDSDAVCSLTFPAEVFYRRLMSVVDDFGRFDGRAAVLRSRLYPLQIDKVREADIERWIAECVKSGLIALYSVSGKPYILFRKLGDPRAKESKWPAPPAGVERDQPFADESSCEQTQTPESRPEQTPADAPYSDSDSDSISGAGSKTSGVPPPAVIVTFPTDGNPGEWHLTESHVAEWQGLYPSLDILAECRKALAWVQAKASNRKTAGGMKRFLVGWLNRATERGGVPRQQSQPFAKTQPGESNADKAKRLRAEMEAARTAQEDNP